MKRLVVNAAIMGSLAAGGLAVQATRIHDAYGAWRLTATETPLRLTALHREYDRSHLPPTSAPPWGFESRGQTDGGGTILAPTGLKERTPVVIYVQDGEGRVWSYGLVGGP